VDGITSGWCLVANFDISHELSGSNGSYLVASVVRMEVVSRPKFYPPAT
jgi:hypothetical protein